VTDALDLLAGLVIEDGRRWGEAATERQLADAASILDLDSTTPYHFVTRARGYSKTSDLSAIALASMLCQLPPGSRVYACAADLDQGRLLLDSLAGFCQRTSGLHDEVTIGASRATVTRLGTTLDVIPADASSSWGLRPDLVLVDELGVWPTTAGAKRLWESVSSAAAKRERCRMVVATTASDPAHWSRKVLDFAIGDPAWRVSETPGAPPWLSREKLAEQKRRLPESQYRRLFENVWMSGEDRLADPDAIAACATLSGPLPPDPRWRYVCSLDVGLVNDLTATVIAHAEAILTLPEGSFEPMVTGHRVVCDRLQCWQGSRSQPVALDEVEEYLALAAESYKARLVLDPWQSAALAQRLRRRGYRVAEHLFSQQSASRLAITLLTLLRDKRLAIPRDEALLEQLANVRIREVGPGILRVDHDRDQHDDMAVALGMACVSLLDNAPSLPGRDPVVGGFVDRSIYGDGFDEQALAEGRLSSVSYGQSW
jgi:phage terminase large subunit-like protein